MKNKIEPKFITILDKKTILVLAKRSFQKLTEQHYIYNANIEAFWMPEKEYPILDIKFTAFKKYNKEESVDSLKYAQMLRASSDSDWVEIKGTIDPSHNIEDIKKQLDGYAKECLYRINPLLFEGKIEILTPSGCLMDERFTLDSIIPDNKYNI